MWLRNGNESESANDFSPLRDDDSDSEDSDVEEDAYRPFTPGSMLKLGACALCRFNLDLWQRWARDELVQLVIERITDDLCYLGRFGLYLSSCRSLSRHVVPGILNNFSEIVLTPDYFCPLMGMCEPIGFLPLDASDDIEKILADKPAYLQNDDFIDKLYEKLA